MELGDLETIDCDGEEISIGIEDFFKFDTIENTIKTLIFMFSSIGFFVLIISRIMYSFI